MQKTSNPFVIVISGTIVLLMLGVAYVWGVYLKPLMDEFGWSKALASLPFSIFLLSYAFGMIIGGRLQDKYGPRIICSLGALLFGGAYLLSGFTNSLIYLSLVYGLIGGIGTGFAYITPMSAVVKWYPHKKGLMGGIVVFGFGAGAFFLSPVVREIITLYGWRTSFILLGTIFIIITFLAANFIKNPPENWHESVNTKQPVKQPLMETSGRQTIKTPIFWALWTVWFFALTAGLGLMGHIVSFAMETGIDKMAAAFCLSIIAVFNGLGRIAMGAISDKIGRTTTLSIALFGFSVISALIPLSAGKIIFLYTLCSLFGICFGTCLVLYPAIAADVFGTKYLGTNYGLLFSSYGIGGVVGPLLFGYIYDKSQQYLIAFIISFIICFIGGLLTIFVKKIEKRLNKLRGC